MYLCLTYIPLPQYYRARSRDPSSFPSPHCNLKIQTTHQDLPLAGKLAKLLHAGLLVPGNSLPGM